MRGNSHKKACQQEQLPPTPGNTRTWSPGLPKSEPISQLREYRIGSSTELLLRTKSPTTRHQVPEKTTARKMVFQNRCTRAMHGPLNHAQGHKDSKKARTEVLGSPSLLLPAAGAGIALEPISAGTSPICKA